jgi:hypothetical protein|tara:strand:+ start:1196 stop:1462 length:267 start_codon:yes stop_codon:yes gene_type:complete
MDPIQAINILSQVVKTAKLPYNEHVVLERCVDILTQSIQNKDEGGNIQSDGASVTFEDPIEEPVAELVATSDTQSKGKNRAQARKGGK